MIHTNTFAGGMSADNDVLLQGKAARFMRNSRIAYNRKKQSGATLEDALDGKTGDWVPVRGTLSLVGMCAGYDIVGSVKVRSGSVIFSTNGVHSEIGLLEVFQPEAAQTKYQTLYNDINDPNRLNNPFLRRLPSDADGDLLHFSKQHFIKGYSHYENELIERVYFTDGRGQKRTFNLNDFFSEANQTNPFHFATGCEAAVNYPKHLSVHAMDEQPDAVLPMIRFQCRVSGKLKTGTYKLGVRYKNKNGVRSPVRLYESTVFVTNQPMEDPLGDTTMTQALRANHHNRVMADKNGVNSSEGIRWDIIDIDSRWDEMEVIYVYYQDAEIHSEAYVFRRITLYNERSMTVDLTQNSPIERVFYPITAEELQQTFQTVLSVGHTATKDNRNWDANLRFLPDIRLDLTKAQVRPAYQYLRPDQTIEPKFDYIYNKISGRYDGDPLTNAAPFNSQINISRYAGKTDTFPVVDDYYSYKSQQIASILGSHFRGETYEYGVVVVDRKGNRMLVERLAEYTFPQQYENYPFNTLTRKAVDGQYDLRVLGASFSGIKIPVDFLYDEFGRLNISAIQIVRKPRLKRLKRQGVVFPTLMGAKCETKTADDGWVKPLGFAWNNFLLGYAEVHRGDTHTYLQGFISCNHKPSWWNFGNQPPKMQPAVSAPYIFNFHSPDILIEETLEENVKGDYLQHVGQLHQAYTSNAIQLSGMHNFHVYTKSYNTQLFSYMNPAIEAQYVNQGRPAIGSRTRIKWAFRHTKSEDTFYEKFDPDFWKYDYSASTDMYRGWMEGDGFDFPCIGIQQPGSVVLRASDWGSVDLTESGHNQQTNQERDERSCSYRIVNWYGSVDQTEVRRYFVVKHIPITPETLQELAADRDATGKLTAYVLNDVEVYNGDAYPTLFGFTRIYSGLDECRKNPDRASSDFPDTATSHIFPLESQYNLDLLYGRKFPANATCLARTYCAGEDLQFVNGIMIRQPEDWNYNKALLAKETILFYDERPADVNFVSHRPNGIIKSPVKFSGEEIDRYRIKLPGDYHEIEGNEGPINGLVAAFDYLYYIRERSFGILLINQRNFIPSDQGEVMVSSGQVFSGKRDLAAYGTKYPNSIWQDGERFGFVDTVMKKIVGFSQAGRDLTSESNNVDDLVRALTMNVEEVGEFHRDIISGYDSENQEALFTFFGAKTELTRTLAYSAKLSSFVGIRDVSPHVYIPLDDYLISVRHSGNLRGMLQLHNYGRYGYFYGQYFDSTLRMVVNPSPTALGVFNNGFILGHANLMRRLLKVTAWSDSERHVIPMLQVINNTIVNVDDRFNYQKGQLAFPLHEWDWEDVKQVLKGHQIQIELTIANGLASVDGLDLPVSITAFDTAYRIGYPNQY